MLLEETPLQGLLIIHPAVFKDERGYFFEAYNQERFKINALEYNFIQDNQSFSKKGVIRGLHYQKAPYAQAKLVRVLEGEILDVAVDLRKDSASYGKHLSIILSAENKKQLMIPAGFAHGFSVLSESASVLYKVDQPYNKESERGIRYDDPVLNIDWKVPSDEVIVSEKDLVLPFFVTRDS